MDEAPWTEHWILMVSYGIRWYCMVFDGILLLNGIQWYCIVFNGNADYYMVFDGIQ